MNCLDSLSAATGCTFLDSIWSRKWNYRKSTELDTVLRNKKASKGRINKFVAKVGEVFLVIFYSTVVDRSAGVQFSTSLKLCQFEHDEYGTAVHQLVETTTLASRLSTNKIWALRPNIVVPSLVLSH